MGSISVEQFLDHPDKLLSDAQGGEIAVVTQDGEAVFMAVPMGAGAQSADLLLEIAARLYDREQISVGVAARIAGLTISDMIDALGSRGIPVVRYEGDEFMDELDYARTLARRG